MEDLLLILLGLVWLGLTLYRNSQKKKQQVRAPQQRQDDYTGGEEEERDAGSMLEDLFGDSLYSGPMSEEEKEDATLVRASGREPFIRNEDITEPGVISLETSKFPERYETLEDLFEDEGDLTKVGSVLDEDVYNIQEEEGEEEEEPEFDLKRAVIYSEILKRPDF